MPTKYKINCRVCGKYCKKNRGRFYCSNQCCGNDKERNKKISDRQKGVSKPYISLIQKGKPKPWLRGKKLTEETKKKISLARRKNPTRFWLGKKRPPETIKKMSLALKAKPLRYWLGKKLPQSTLEALDRGRRNRIPYVRTPEMRKKMSEDHKGEKAWNWKGGISSRNKHAGVEYAKWRVSVFNRDNWTCQNCKKHGGYLEAHHIKSFLRFIELRLELANGITLCKPCHKTANLEQSRRERLETKT